MVGLICCVAALAVIITAFLWVSGIDYMKENHPDYKGEDLFGEENEIHFKDVFNEEKKEDLKKFISEHKKNIKND
jgi:hypothetical protein